MRVTLAQACTILLLLGVTAACSPRPQAADLSGGSCGIRVSSRADFEIPALFGSVRLEGLPDDRIVDPGVRPGETRWFQVPCWAECVVVQGSGTDPLTRRTVRFEGFAELVPGEFTPLRLDRKQGTQTAQRVALSRGCVPA